MKILLTGTNGQVGYELQRQLHDMGEIVALGRDQMDLSDLDEVREVIRSVKPSLIINPAAYTAVDHAELNAELALRVNAEAPEVMAEEARKLGAAMIHYSTDYVMDGTKCTPYTEEDQPSPRSVYGRTKLAGDEAIQAAGIPHLILRTSWVYGRRGKNFLMTMLRLAQERDELRIVGDQHGTPTWCRTIATATAQILKQASAAEDAQQWWREKGGLYCLTAQGKTTWHGFTQEIMTNAGLPKTPRVIAINTKDYPTFAERPAYSVLSCSKLEKAFGLTPPPWEQGVRQCMQENDMPRVATGLTAASVTAARPKNSRHSREGGNP
jgi:dTDP-4-dehydrorhamnose reductase